MLPEARRLLCRQHATRPTSPTNSSGRSSNHSSAGPKDAADRPGGPRAPGRGRCVLPAEERLPVADAAPGVPALADRLILGAIILLAIYRAFAVGESKTFCSSSAGV